MGNCFCIHTAEIGVVEQFGKYHHPAEPGCHCLMPCTQTLAGKVSLRVQHAEIRVETKTKDNVFVWLSVSTMYQVFEDKVEQAYYTLSDPKRQIESFVFNSIRGQIPEYNIDDVFRLRNEIAKALKAELDEQMHKYGYFIIAALITDIDPDRTVKEAMNQINTNARLKIAIADRAEASKIELVKAAEADAEAKRLSGVGLAEQRRAILNGLQTSVASFKEKVKGTTSTDVMTLLLLNQYFDTLKDVAVKGSAKVVFTPPQLGMMGSHSDEVRMGIM
eukprot:PhF_6_TR5487/c0_g1_i4/m.7748